MIRCNSSHFCLTSTFIDQPLPHSSPNLTRGIAAKGLESEPRHYLLAAVLPSLSTQADVLSQPISAALLFSKPTVRSLNRWSVAAISGILRTLMRSEIILMTISRRPVSPSTVDEKTCSTAAAKCDVFQWNLQERANLSCASCLRPLTNYFSPSSYTFACSPSCSGPPSAEGISQHS